MSIVNALSVAWMQVQAPFCLRISSIELWKRMGCWNGHVCEFISSLITSFHFKNIKTWQNSRSSALPPLLQPLTLLLPLLFLSHLLNGSTKRDVASERQKSEHVWLICTYFDRKHHVLHLHVTCNRHSYS